MINIIDHIWQAELKNFPILPTLIKFAGNLPKCYFYSQKQKRVLRKKDQGVEAALDFLGRGDASSRNYLLVRQVLAGEVQFSLVLKCEVEELMNSSTVNCVIIQLQQSQSFMIDCCFDPQGKVSIKPLMLYIKEKSFWSGEVGHLEVSSPVILQYMANFWRELPKQLKVKSKCRKIQLILSVSPTFDAISILWCSELSFDAQEFYQIRYEYRIKPIELQVLEVSRIRPSETAAKIEIRHNFEGKPPEQAIIQPSQTNKADLKQITCNGCGRNVIEQGCKQAQNSDVVSLRRRHGLSIMGIRGEYLQVCEQCYYAIDE